MKGFVTNYQSESVFTLTLSEREERRKGERGKNQFFLTPLLPCYPAILLLLFTLLSFTFAQTPQDAINLAGAHSSFAKGLADRPGWTAVAYDTKNFYSIWRVQFYDAEGNDLGWSDVNLEKQKIYAWETNFDVTESEYSQAEEALLNFARQDPEVIEMIGNIDEYSFFR